MTSRHTISPIWCVALVLAACGDDKPAAPAPTAAAPTVERAEEATPAPEKAAPVVEATPVVAEPTPTDEEVETPPVPVVSDAAVARALGAVAPSVLTLPPDGQQMSVGDAVAGAAPAPTPSAEKLKAGDAPKGPLRLISGFDEPMAVIHDAAADAYLVSNLNSQGESEPGKGYISRVNADGTIDAQRWIDGAAKRAKLRTPRGMAIISGRLYVADGAVIRVYDRQTGVKRGTVRIDGATQLNGLATGRGNILYAADSSFGPSGRSMGTDAVYRINRSGRASALFKSSVLGHPSGVVQQGGVVWISTVGSGKLYGLERNGHLISGPRLSDGRLAGMTVIGKDDVVVTTIAGSGVYRGSLTEGLDYLRTGIPTPGHPGWDPERRRVLVPSQASGDVHVITLPAPEKASKKKRRR